jgi:hypothetical protein
VDDGVGFLTDGEVQGSVAVDRIIRGQRRPQRGQVDSLATVTPAGRR